MAPPSSALAVHDPEHMREVLQRHLPALAGTSFRVRECRIANTRRRDGSRGATQYELRMEDPATGRIWDQIVSGITYGGDRTRRLWESMNQMTESRAGTSAQPGLPPFAYVPELDLLLQVFPHDLRLPALARLMAGPPPELVPAVMEEFGPGAWQMDSWHAEVVQYRVDMRAIVRITVGATEPTTGRISQRQYFAKVYRDAEQGHRAYHAQRDLHERASAGGQRLVIAKPIIYVDDLRTLVTEAVPGRSLSKLIRRDKGALAAVRASARAVAEFHRLDVAAPSRAVTGEIARLAEAREVLASARPDLADDVSRMVEVVTAGLDGTPSALIHGDLKPDHILVDGDRVALIDFDLLAVADPVMDVAHLVAFLGKPQERSRSRREETHDLAQVFVDAYFADTPGSWRARLPLYHAMTSIHKAVGLCRRRGSDRQDLVADVLREGQTFLESDGDGAVPSYKRRLTRSAVR